MKSIFQAFKNLLLIPWYFVDEILWTIFQYFGYYFGYKRLAVKDGKTGFSFKNNYNNTVWFTPDDKSYLWSTYDNKK